MNKAAISETNYVPGMLIPLEDLEFPGIQKNLKIIKN